jgi:hypothetical protein
LRSCGEASINSREQEKGNSMAQLSLSKAWEDTRDIFARDGGLLTAVALAMFVLPETVVGLITPPVGAAMTPAGRLVWLIGVLIGVVGQLALVRLALGPSTTVGQAIQHGARRFLPTIAALLLLGIALALIVLPLMILAMKAGVVEVPVEGQTPPHSCATFAIVIAIAALLVSVKFTMSVPVSAAEQPRPVTILKRSWQLTAGHYWRLLGFIALLLVTTVIVLLAAQSVGGIVAQLIGGGVAPFSLGALVLALFQGVASAVVTTLFAVMGARIYRQLAGPSEAQAGVPNSGI